MTESPERPDPTVLDSLVELGGPGFLAQLLDIYLRESPERLAAIDRALAAHDGHALSGVAHSLLSSSAHLGARAVAETARAIERLAFANEWDALPTRIETLRELLDYACVTFRLRRDAL